MSTNIFEQSGEASTVGAQTVTIASIGVGENTGGSVHFTVVGRNGSTIYLYEVRAVFNRTTGNVTVSQAGLLDTVLGLLTANVAIAANGANVELRMTGAIGQTVVWIANGKFICQST